MCSDSDKVRKFFVEGPYSGLNNRNHDSLTLNLREMNSGSSRVRTRSRGFLKLRHMSALQTDQN